MATYKFVVRSKIICQRVFTIYFAIALIVELLNKKYLFRVNFLWKYNISINDSVHCQKTIRNK